MRFLPFLPSARIERRFFQRVQRLPRLPRFGARHLPPRRCPLSRCWMRSRRVAASFSVTVNRRFLTLTRALLSFGATVSAPPPPPPGGLGGASTPVIR